jgi:hypothetical protein
MLHNCTGLFSLELPEIIIQVEGYACYSCHSLRNIAEFDWNDMVITLGRANASTAVIQNLLDIQQSLSPEYSIDWDQILGELTERAKARPRFTPFASSATICFLISCSIEKRVNAIGVKHFRDAMADDWMGCNSYYFNGHAWRTDNLDAMADNWMGEYDLNLNGQAWRIESLTKLEYYESEYLKLKMILRIHQNLDFSVASVVVLIMSLKMFFRIFCPPITMYLLPTDYDNINYNNSNYVMNMITVLNIDG